LTKENIEKLKSNQVHDLDMMDANLSPGMRRTATKHMMALKKLGTIKEKVRKEHSDDEDDSSLESVKSENYSSSSSSASALFSDEERISVQIAQKTGQW
jgi:hypothetical protein